MHITTFLPTLLLTSTTASAAAVLLPRDLRPNPPGGTCNSPGDYKCGALVIYDGFAFPGVGWHGESSSRLATVVNGNCDSIHTDGTLDPQGGGNGFYGGLQTSYGTAVEVQASYIDAGQIEGVQVKYFDQTIDESQCEQFTSGFDPAYTIVQCNFSC